MKRLLPMILLSAFMTLLTCPGICQQIQLGQTWLNQSLNGEIGPNILITDFRFQLDAPDAGATYRARLHDDALIWQRLEVMPKRGNVSAFYSLDRLNENWLNGAGIRFSQSQGIGRSIELMGGVYDRGFCVETACSVERSGFVSRIGYEYRKLGDLRWWGPSVSLGVTW